jgi:hypothetical protein
MIDNALFEVYFKFMSSFNEPREKLRPSLCGYLAVILRLGRIIERQVPISPGTEAGGRSIIDTHI